MTYEDFQAKMVHFLPEVQEMGQALDNSPEVWREAQAKNLHRVLQSFRSYLTKVADHGAVVLREDT